MGNSMLDFKKILNLFTQAKIVSKFRMIFSSRLTQVELNIEIISQEIFARVLGSH